MSVVSVGAVLAERLMNEDSHSLYLYRDRYEREVHDEGIYRDIFSGSVYRDQWQNQGIFANPGDVGLLIVVDGFQPKHKNKATMTTICGYIMTMEPTERYKDENVITFAVIPGPKKPANLMSFLDPILSEIKDLGEHGFDIKKNGESIFCGKS
ncbi:hypothetical protein G6F56_013869 [Rhizopus delemar]|nr:hypothetical protein G6F56_013869 [Rhizopus delemar]